MCSASCVLLWPSPTGSIELGTHVSEFPSSFVPPSSISDSSFHTGLRYSVEGSLERVSGELSRYRPRVTRPRVTTASCPLSLKTQHGNIFPVVVSLGAERRRACPKSAGQALGKKEEKKREKKGRKVKEKRGKNVALNHTSREDGKVQTRFFFKKNKIKKHAPAHAHSRDNTSRRDANRRDSPPHDRSRVFQENVD